MIKIMKKISSKYSRFLGTAFFIWLCLKLAEIFKLDFAVNLSFLFWTLLLISFPLLAWVIKENWDNVVEFIENINLEIKKIFLTNTKNIQASYKSQIESEMVRKRETSGDGFFNKFSNAIFRINIICHWFLKRYILNKRGMLSVVFAGIMFNLFILKFTPYLIGLSLIALWLWSIRLFKFRSKTSLVIALTLLTMCPFLVILKKIPIAERAANWAYVFLMISAIQESVFFRKNKGENIA